MRRTLAMLVVLAGAVHADAAAQVVHGRVVVAGTGEPVPAASVRLLPASGSVAPLLARADGAGAFTLRPGAAGVFRLAAEGPGLRRAVSPVLQLGRGDSLQVLVRLSADTVLLAPLEVVAQARRGSPWLEGFYARAERGAFGHFVMRDEIEKRAAPRTSELLRRVPGLMVRPTRAGSVVLGRGGCRPDLFIDGFPTPRGMAGVDLTAIPEQLEGIEVYPPGSVPAEFSGNDAGCGVILLWTRVGG